MSTNILLAGLSPDWLKTAASKGYDLGRNQQEKIAESIKKQQADLATYKDTHFQEFLLYPDDEAQWQKFVTLLQSKKWDAITYGGGVRTVPQLSDYFTSLIHQVMKDQPQTKLLFPLLPEDVGPLLKKHVPQAK